MATSIQMSTVQTEHHQKRTKSSVLRSIVGHRRNPSAGAALASIKSENQRPATQESSKDLPILPSDYTHASPPLIRSSQTTDTFRSSPKKSVEVYDEEKKRPSGLQVRGNGTISLNATAPKKEDGTQKPDGSERERKPKKSKSSTNLSALLSRPRSSKTAKKESVGPTKDKENQTPPDSDVVAPTPIWAQFASQPAEGTVLATKVPLNDRWRIEDEMALYTPKEYSPSKQRNYDASERPTLSRRPRSEYLPSGPTAASFAETVARLRKTSTGKKNSTNLIGGQGAEAPSSKVEKNINLPNEVKPSGGRLSEENLGTHCESSKADGAKTKRGSRVMAAVAAWNGKSKERVAETSYADLNTETIESAFENLLDSRNVSQEVRDKMRTLDTTIKADFVKQNRSGSASSTGSLAAQAAFQSTHTRPSTGPELVLNDPNQNGARLEMTQEFEATKKPRPRSMTFTLGKGDSSPTKKQKSERKISHGRAKSIDLVHSSSSKSLTSASAAQALTFMNKTPKPAIPDDFVSYLRKFQKPEVVEVGKLHKLRQLLRNEAVSWVDSFITKGGMAEVVALLHRIIKVEWREEHEDALLHETLLCLKALCTTSLALAYLSTIENSLFPTLLALLFSDDKKGPSEFTTRSIIVSLLFTYLSTSPTLARADKLLSYLRDPSLPEEAQPPGFITSIYVPRPYRFWCKEIVNVTKEVFWIFLHHLNVVPYPALPSSSENPTTYASIHFPPTRPPVPAAPYVGGVEWEATNYLAAHLDLLNGLLASLSTREERNALRQELKDSGLEKIMGGTLRTCKEKFYGGVHAGLATWIGAAREDGWSVSAVREGPPREEVKIRSASPKKKKDQPPKLDMPKLELSGKAESDDRGWL